jgi:hypothetical protein
MLLRPPLRCDVGQLSIDGNMHLLIRHDTIHHTRQSKSEFTSSSLEVFATAKLQIGTILQSRHGGVARNHACTIRTTDATFTVNK